MKGWNIFFLHWVILTFIFFILQSADYKCIVVKCLIWSLFWMYVWEKWNFVQMCKVIMGRFIVIKYSNRYQYRNFVQFFWSDTVQRTKCVHLSNRTFRECNRSVLIINKIFSSILFSENISYPKIYNVVGVRLEGTHSSRHLITPSLVPQKQELLLHIVKLW